MSELTTNLRKAAILIRSLDADTAAKLLGQLSPAEAKSLRLAIQSLGPIEADERADVAAEFRRVTPVAAQDPRAGVEIDFSNSDFTDTSVATPTTYAASKPFKFLEHAKIESLVPYLAREQSQTIAVVMSYLAPEQAALVLAALPARLQAETIERLSIQGDTDPASLHVLERELAAWLSRQQSTRSRTARHTGAVAAILAAADELTRGNILTNLAKHNRQLAEEVMPRPTSELPTAQSATPARSSRPSQAESVSLDRKTTGQAIAPDCATNRFDTTIAANAPLPLPRPGIKFDDLARLVQADLAAVLRTVEADVLVLALAGADDELVDRIAAQLPRKVAKTFRKRLLQLGPTRLRDVAAAQQDVAEVATKIVQARRRTLAAMAG
ncbi:MAG TPA: FliG C-terminal domain-containing protein [Lacipirellulaceae bacterium]|jgi:flagellar motor switch protein FliG